MRLVRVLGCLIVLVSFSRVAHAAWPHDDWVNVPIAIATGQQQVVNATSDSSGGMYVVWQDSRNGNWDIFIQRVLGDGTIAPGWPSNGLPIGYGVGDQTSPNIFSDGAGNAFVSWNDTRAGTHVYAQKVLATGSIAPGWAANGMLLCTNAATQLNAAICSDGAGGLYSVFQDFRVAAGDLYSQHITSAGALGAGYVMGGNALIVAAGLQAAPAIGRAPFGGFVVAWQDYRAGAVPDLYAIRADVSGLPWGGWPVAGLAVCVAAGAQSAPAVLADGTGGLYIAWSDSRGADPDIYVQGVGNWGGIGSGWAVDGELLCGAVGDQRNPRLTWYEDGVMVAWEDYRGGPTADVVAHAINNYGNPVPQFPVDGFSVCSAAGDQLSPIVTSDDLGGVYIAWYDNRSGGFDNYVQYVSPGYFLGVGWPTNGRRVSGAGSTQGVTVPVGDATGSVLLAWNDFRNGSWDIYAQRVDRFGPLGNPEASIAKVRDVAGDQGGRVRVDWNASYLDVAPTFRIEGYGVWRQAPAAAAQSALAHGARLVKDTREAAALQETRTFRTTTFSSQTIYWEFMTSLPARALPAYSYVCATTTDSTASANPRTMFMIEATDVNGFAFWLSAPDSGYSVDNVAPAAPGAFSAQYFPGSSPSAASTAASAAPYAWLHWTPAAEADFLEYRIHRGSTAGFTPGPGNLVATQTDTGFVDVGAPPSYYKLVTLDVHGNASIAATALPNGALDAPLATGVALAFAPISPNPALRAARLSFHLPARQQVSLAIYDPLGRRVRVLADEALAPGPNERVWDCRDDAGARVSPGVYFARLVTGGRAITRRVSLIGD